MFDEATQLVQGRFHITPKGFRVIFLISALMMLAALALVWPNVKKVKLSYYYQALETEHEKLLSENHLLRLEKESLQSLYRIQALATDVIGMVEPKKEQVITIFLK
jgi:cell division protein FtsL